MVKKILIGAHYGIKDWAIQRLSAVVMLVFLIFFLAGLFFVPSTFEGWRAFFTTIPVKVVAQILVLAIVIHAWIGVRDIWMDYVHNAGARVFMNTFSAVWLLASLLYSISIIWGV